VNSVRSQRLARVGLAAIVGIAALEWLAGSFAYRSTIEPEHWADVRQSIEGAPAVFVATEWLSPLARLHLAAAATPHSVGAADLRGLPEFIVLGYRDEIWSDPLERDLDGMPRPRAIQTRRIGPLSVTRYRQEDTGVVQADLLETPLQIRTPTGPCTGSDPWRCREGILDVRYAEIDYRPRRCLAIDLDDGTPVTIASDALGTGTMIRGHLGFSDFNGRLRSDSPVRVTLSTSARTLGRWIVSDEQGWFSFAAPLEASTGAVGPLEVEVLVPASGTWGTQGYNPTNKRTACLELRAFQEKP
jgi:hypothetical protein